MARVSFKQLPSDEEPIGELLSRVERKFKRENVRRKAEKWMPIHFNETLPFGVVWFGDPHLDDGGVNMPLLRGHIAICQAPGIYAACVGDYTNNWVGNLARLYGDQETGKKSARRLVHWFMNGCGLRWALLLLGNHDTWNEGEAILGLMADKGIHLANWEAQLEFRAAGQKWLVHVAHDFKGSSIHIPCYGGIRKARTESPAELFISGHRHSYGTASLADCERSRFIRVAMARGYKWSDQHAKVNGYTQNEEGASIMTVFNPYAKTRAGRITVFEDLEMGAAVLKSLRDQHLPKRTPQRAAKPRNRKPR